jgi:hypothetical protein
MSSIDRATRLPPDRVPPLARVVAPLAVVGLAALLWFSSERLVSIGPLDRATFGWAVVVPLWVAAPIDAGFAWQPLERRSRLLAAAASGVVLGGTLTVVLWLDAVGVSCEFGATRAGVDWIGPTSVVGLAVGGALALSSANAVQQVAAGRRWNALLSSALIQVVAVPFAAALFFVAFFGTCNRP